MRFFLDSLIGDGDSENPWRSEHADGNHTIINLRPAPFCLVGAEALVGTPIIDFGDTLNQILKNNRIRALANRLGLTLEQVDLRAIIAELLLLHGREDGTRWRPLKQDTNGRHRIFLGNQPVYDAPVIVGASFTDNFNRTDEDLQASANWANVKGAMDVESNIAAIDTNKSIYRCESAMDTDDHYAQCDLVIRDDQPGINARMSEGDLNGWDAYHFRNNDGSAWQIFEVTDNGFTEIASDATTEPTPPYTMRVTANGSTISADLDAAEIMSVTDTALTGQVKTGFRDNLATGTDWDNWEIADVAGGDATATPATVGVVAAVPSATLTASVEQVATTVNAPAAVPSATLLASVEHSQATVNAPAAVPSATVSASVEQAATTVDAPAAVPSASALADSLTAPNTVDVVGDVPQADAFAGVTALPATVNAPAAVPSATATASVEHSQSTVNVVGNVPSATVSASVEQVQATVNVVVAVPVATVTASVEQATTTVNVVVGVPGATLVVSGVAVVSTVNVVVAIPAATASGTAGGSGLHQSGGLTLTHQSGGLTVTHQSGGLIITGGQE